MALTIYDSFRPMELYLKFTGLLPLFWRSNTTIVQRLLNWTVLGVNLAACVFVSNCMLQKVSANDPNFFRRGLIRKALNYCIPIVITIAGFCVAARFRKIFSLMNQVDYEVEVLKISLDAILPITMF